MELKGVGRATVKAFGVRSRFVHLEFFRLTKAKPGLGEVGDFDVYQIWADMVTDNKRKLPDSGQHSCAVYASRRDCHRYVHSHEEILERYGESIVMCERMPEMMVPQIFSGIDGEGI